MQANDHSRSFGRPGPLWPQGKTLDDIRRRPSLTSRDGSVRITAGPTGTDLATGPLVPASATWDAATSQWVVTVQAWVMIQTGYVRCYQYTGTTEWRFAATTASTYMTLLWLPYYWDADVTDSRIKGSVVWAPANYGLEQVAAVSGNTAEGLEVSWDYTTIQAPDVALGSLWLLSDRTSVWQWGWTVPGDVAIRRPFGPAVSGCRATIGYQRDTGSGVLIYEDSVACAIPGGTDSNVYVVGPLGRNPETFQLSAPGSGEWGWNLFHIETAASGRLVALTAHEQQYWFYDKNVYDNADQGWTGSFVIAPYTYSVVAGIITGRA